MAKEYQRAAKEMVYAKLTVDKAEEKMKQIKVKNQKKGKKNESPEPEITKHIAKEHGLEVEYEEAKLREKGAEDWATQKGTVEAEAGRIKTVAKFDFVTAIVRAEMKRRPRMKPRRHIMH